MLLFFGSPKGKILDENILKNGYADEFGEFRSTVSKDMIGEKLNCRIRHAGYEFQDEEFVIQPYGVVYSTKTRLDGIFKGKIRGVDVGDLSKYGKQAAQRADQYRQDAFAKLRWTGLTLSQIPFLFWLILYLVNIIVFSLDYYLLGDSFDKDISSYFDAFYFSSITITTLGYGDIVPDSIFTKLLTSLQSISGIMIIGLFLNSLFHVRESSSVDKFQD
ncbi:MAG: potassium channel family protein [Nitrospinales bacterium]